ncbi:MAG: tail fiber domain-containing protein [Bacteroidales bacterium]|nr:tail fiber domain-containing protein [Bacteroidales bacterium]
MKTKLFLRNLSGLPKTPGSVKTPASGVSAVVIIILIMCTAPPALSQIPQGFNYQAVARDATGTSLVNTPLPVRITIQVDSLGTTILWQELHQDIVTNNLGMINLVVGKGTRQASSTVALFSDIDWSVSPKFIKTEINYSGWKTMGVSRLWSVPYSLVAEDLAGSVKRLTVTGETDSMEEALFEVKNKTGQTVFAVYNEGVRVYVSDGDAKGLKGGFAVGGFGTDKAESTKYMFIGKDSVRFYLDTNPLTKKLKGGFAVGGYDLTKGTVQNYLDVSADSVRIYIDSNPEEKKLKGGFAVGGYDLTKGITGDYFNVSGKSDAETINGEARVLWYPDKEAFMSGNVLIESKDSVGTNSWASGYQSKAIGNYSQALGYQAIARSDYSTAIGKNAVADSIYSYALGENARAKGHESYALGRGAVADGFRSFALGSAGVDSAGQVTGVAYAKGDYSFAIGQGSRSEGIGAFAIGVADSAKGDFATALGYKNSAYAYGSTAIGYYSRSNEFSNAFGSWARAEGYTSNAFGFNTRASGLFSTSIGSGSTASGSSSLVLGRNSKATGPYSTGLGIYVTAGGKYSLAIGYFALSNMEASISMGYKSIASGFHSIAIGCQTVASGESSIALGDSTVASGPQGSTSLGFYTKAIGGGSTAMGGYSKAVGGFSTAMGLNTVANGAGSFAIGSSAIANNYSSIAMGNNTQANGYNSISIGNHSVSPSCFETVIGSFNAEYVPASSDSWNYEDRLFVIGNGTWYDDRKNALTVLKNGCIGLQSVTSPTYALELPNNSNAGVGQARAYAWATYSDGRAKSEKTELLYGLEEIMQLVPAEYLHHSTIKGNEGIIIQEDGRHDIGLIAQDVYKIIPEAVNRPEKEEDELWSISYDKLVPVLINAIKEQQQQIETQQLQIDSQNLKIEQLYELIGQMHANFKP